MPSLERTGRRYLLCRPQGGLNDSLCQIELCCRYCERFGRTLVVDARNSGLLGNLEDYFTWLPGHTFPIEAQSPELYAFLDKATCYPPFVAGRLTQYKTQWTPDQSYVEQESRQPVRFDFSVDYEETVLVHDRAGGGLLSVRALARIELTATVRDQIIRGLTSLGPRYEAIHIRNTDYKTDYLPFFEKIYPKVRNKTLLVCSDNHGTIEQARRYFDQSEVRILMPIPDLGGRPVHRNTLNGTESERALVATAALVDLMALASARKLYVTKTEKKISGYSRLAHYLHRNRALLSSLLGLRPRSPVARSLWNLKAGIHDSILMRTV